MSSSELETKATVDALYKAYFAHDTEGMLATMSNDVEVRFLGREKLIGINQARQFFSSNNTALENLDFRIRKLLINGDWAAVIWDESATALGQPYENHGVDLFRVRDNKITVLHENNDIVVRRNAFANDSNIPELDT